MHHGPGAARSQLLSFISCQKGAFLGGNSELNFFIFSFYSGPMFHIKVNLPVDVGSSTLSVSSPDIE